jgi:hypothetical protein
MTALLQAAWFFIPGLCTGNILPNERGNGKTMHAMLAGDTGSSIIRENIDTN